MKKSLLIFDMDGTILNTLDDLRNSVNFSLAKHGFPLRSLEQIRLAIGNGIAMLVKRSLPINVDNETYKNVLYDFEKHYALHNSDLTKAYDGMLETLIELKNKGYKLAVSTNKIENVAQELVNKIYPNIFEMVAGDNNKRKKKPAPDSIFDIIQNLNISNKREVIYIGDTEVDYQTAKNAGIECILVSYGYRTVNELTEMNLDIKKIIHSPKYLAKIMLANN
ncbi:MAG: HAD-IIIA family hydrolase [Bacilli bacterium]|nr:HAD-IIIA family hydrolase [Bacilli bacterium]